MTELISSYLQCFSRTWVINLQKSINYFFKIAPKKHYTKYLLAEDIG
jgi:hypothetical protein